jgi:hypothetical protein
MVETLLSGIILGLFFTTYLQYIRTENGNFIN